MTDFVVVVNQPPREVQVGSRSSLGSSEAGDQFGFERDQQFPLASPEVQMVFRRSLSGEELKTVLLNGYDNSFSRILYYQSLLFSPYLIAWVFHFITFKRTNILKHSSIGQSLFGAATFWLGNFLEAA